MQLEDAIRRFLEGYFATHDRSPKTRKAYELDLRQFRLFLGHTKTLQEITPEALESWAAHLRAGEYKPASIRRKFASIKVLVRHWLRRGALDASPFDRVRLEFGKAKTLPKHLTETQSRRLLTRAIEEAKAQGETAPGPRSLGFRAARNRAIVEVLLLTGMRVGELAALQLGDWREEDQVLKVRGKGDRERFAPISSCEGLVGYLRRREAVPTPHRHIFVNLHGSPLTTQSVASMLSSLSRRAGIQKRVTPHMLRHTAATLLLENGADIRVVQRLLGHRSILTTQSYTHVTNRHLIGQLARHHPLSCPSK